MPRGDAGEKITLPFGAFISCANSRPSSRLRYTRLNHTMWPHWYRVEFSKLRSAVTSFAHRKIRLDAGHCYAFSWLLRVAKIPNVALTLVSTPGRCFSVHGVGFFDGGAILTGNGLIYHIPSFSGIVTSIALSVERRTHRP